MNYGAFTYREFASGTTRNEGKNSPIIAPGKSIMLELDGNTTISYARSTRTDSRFCF